MTSEFFQNQSEASRIKSEIVTKYFHAWAKVVKPYARRKGGKVGYFDLFAGPGVYDDDTPSTPVLVLEKALADPELARMAVLWFNEAKAEYAKTLRGVLATAGAGGLAHPPIVTNHQVDEQFVELFQKIRTIPSFVFLDPWGYKGLSRHLVHAMTKDWACEAVMFFNYNRLRMAVPNDKVRSHCNALFGEDRVDDLRRTLPALDSAGQEAQLLESLCEALEEIASGLLILPFRFNDERVSRTSHHLIFVTKNALGYHIMKEVMGLASSDREQGVPSFSYVPATPQQSFLFEYNRPLDDLRAILQSHFAGTSKSVKEIYDEHNIGTPFLLRNYKTVLRALAEEDRVTLHRESGAIRKGTLPDDVIVTFPEI